MFLKDADSRRSLEQPQSSSSALTPGTVALNQTCNCVSYSNRTCWCWQSMPGAEAISVNMASCAGKSQAPGTVLCGSQSESVGGWAVEPEAGMDPGCCWGHGPCPACACCCASGASVCCGLPEGSAPPALGHACLGLGQRQAPMGSGQCEEGLGQRRAPMGSDQHEEGLDQRRAPMGSGQCEASLSQRRAPMGSGQCEEGWPSVAGTASASAPLPCTCVPAHCTCAQLLLHVCCMSSVSLLDV